MISTSLPPAPSTHRNTSRAEKLSQLPSPTSVKAAWQRAATQSTPPSPLPLSPRSSATQTKQGQHAPRTPVLPNESFVLLQDSVVRKIPSPIASPATHAKKPSASKSRQNTKVAPAAPQEQPEEVTHPNPSPLSHHLRSTLRLFNLLSSRTELDHPLCSECTQSLLESLTKQLDETKKERDGYVAFEKEVRKERERERDGPNTGEIDAQIEKLKEEERIAVEQLKAAEKERRQLEEELKALELEEKALEEEEAECVSFISYASQCSYASQLLARTQRATSQIRRTISPASLVACGVRCRFRYLGQTRTHECIQRRLLHRARWCLRDHQRFEIRQGAWSTCESLLH